MSALRVLFVLAFAAGVIMAYASRGGGASWVESHYRFQIRIFWIGATIVLLGGLTVPLIVGLVILGLLPFWLLIRCLRGWRLLAHGQAHPHPTSWLFG